MFDALNFAVEFIHLGNERLLAFLFGVGALLERVGDFLDHLLFGFACLDCWQNSIGQVVFLPAFLQDVVTPTEERGEGGFGSSDTKTKRVKK